MGTYHGASRLETCQHEKMCITCDGRARLNFWCKKHQQRSMPPWLTKAFRYLLNSIPLEGELTWATFAYLAKEKGFQWNTLHTTPILQITLKQHSVVLKLNCSSPGGDMLVDDGEWHRECNLAERMAEQGGIPCTIIKIGRGRFTALAMPPGYVSLDNILSNPEARTQLNVLRLAYELCTQLDRMHRRELAVHNDLKANNVLMRENVDGTYTPYLADFGSAMALDADALSSYEEDKLVWVINSLWTSSLWLLKNGRYVFGRDLLKLFNNDRWGLLVTLLHVICGGWNSIEIYVDDNVLGNIETDDMFEKYIAMWWTLLPGLCEETMTAGDDDNVEAITKPTLEKLQEDCQKHPFKGGLRGMVKEMRQDMREEPVDSNTGRWLVASSIIVSYFEAFEEKGTLPSAKELADEFVRALGDEPMGKSDALVVDDPRNDKPAAC